MMTNSLSYFQQSDAFFPDQRKDGDVFMLGNYVVTIVHITNFNAYKVMNLQVTRNIENQVVESNCAGFINLIYLFIFYLFIFFIHKGRTYIKFTPTKDNFKHKYAHLRN